MREAPNEVTTMPAPAPEPMPTLLNALKPFMAKTITVELVSGKQVTGDLTGVFPPDCFHLLENTAKTIVIPTSGVACLFLPRPT